MLSSKATIADVASTLSGKNVLMRVDFNVPVKDGAVSNDARVRATVPTILALQAAGVRGITLMSHLGRPNGQADTNFTLAPVAPVLTGLLQAAGSKKADVKFCDVCVGEKAEQAAGALAEGGVLLLENVRFHVEEEGKGVDAAGEKVKADPAKVTEFRQQLQKLGDIYVNDAFGTAHRAHSSMVLTDSMKKVSGLLLEKELKYFAKALEAPATPFLAILGGAKVQDKIQLIDNLLDKVQLMIIGGGMAFTFKKVIDGMAIGASIFDEDGAKVVEKIVAKAKEKGVDIQLPVDFVVADKFSADAQVKVVTTAEGVPEGWMGLDAGPETQKLNAAMIAKAKTIVWNGPQGVFELAPFAAGSVTALDAVVAATQGGAVSIVGGGDTATLVEQAGKAGEMSHVSTGGGASLELLEGKALPGVVALSSK